MADPVEEAKRAEEASKLARKQAEFRREQAERAAELRAMHERDHPEQHPDK